jgi:UMF1 family MFS transporter
MTELIKNDPKVVRGWCMYDWANSTFSLTVVSAIFPDYFLSVTTNPARHDEVAFLGRDIPNSALFSYAVSFSFLLAALLSPFLSSIADYSGRKKNFMQAFCYLGAVSCALLYFFTEDTITLSVFAFVFASVGYSGSIVFYNSFLPEIVTEDQSDRVSARGFSYGYVGSVILLLFNLIMILKPGWFGNIETSQAVRISFLSVGIWWIVFAQYSFYHLPSNVYKREGGGNWLFQGWKELQKVWNELQWQKVLKKFLVGFFFYNMGVQTVMYVSPMFAKEVVKLETTSLIIIILILQLVAIPGAMFFAWLSGKLNNIQALIVAVIVWIGICIGAYFIRDAMDFYLVATVVGFVMGGIQALSRSTYSKLIPETSIDHASYFSFYDVTDKVAISMGSFVFALIKDLTNNMRISIIFLAVFFVIGLVVLAFLAKGKKESILAVSEV